MEGTRDTEEEEVRDVRGLRGERSFWGCLEGDVGEAGPGPGSLILFEFVPGEEEEAIEAEGK